MNDNLHRHRIRFTTFVCLRTLRLVHLGADHRCVTNLISDVEKKKLAFQSTLEIKRLSYIGIYKNKMFI